jgi:hypothetical protein
MALAVTMQERTRQNAANARMLRQLPLILAWSLLDNCGQSVSLPSVTGDILASGWMASRSSLATARSSFASRSRTAPHRPCIYAQTMQGDVPRPPGSDGR